MDLFGGVIMQPKISVLMPVFNREDFIERSIQSILDQTYINFELLIYDDGSTDNTRQIIEKLSQRDNRIKYYYCAENRGVGYGRNFLLKVCDTKYACWMDSDDISHPERLELQSKLINPNILIFATWENLQKKQPGTTLGFATLMFPVNKTIRFNENMQFGGEDWDWIGKMRENLDGYQCVNKVLYSIDFHGNRIGSWKRKIDKEWGGKYDLKDIEHLSYEEVIEKYKKENNE